MVAQVCHGFGEMVQKQIKEYLNPIPSVSEAEKQKKPPMENWQKFYENGEYLRSVEITEEQNYNMIDGHMNNLPSRPRKIGKRISVLDGLHLKQAEIAKRRGKIDTTDGSSGRYGAQTEINKKGKPDGVIGQISLLWLLIF